MSELTGKAALITGGSRGIGAAIARRLAREGADVAFTYVSTAGEAKAADVVADIKGIGRRALAIRADAAGDDAAADAVRRTAAEFGRLDILVNNAGIFANGPIEDVTPEELDSTLAIHVRSVFLASQAAVGFLPRGGRIISIGSNLADHAPFPGIALYAMSKAALSGFTRGLARELGPRGITANGHGTDRRRGHQRVTTPRRGPEHRGGRGRERPPPADGARKTGRCRRTATVTCRTAG
ncbi:SDR family NAD(P)-dependent oxidoreductase [Streptomyces sp. NPDC059863]|uniref:SDR family NAD(P)-dependent oxidoreductase n=1 Tax=unclassified Streptomyces TaxID=2593676 RepID=UPI00365B3F6B